MTSRQTLTELYKIQTFTISKEECVSVKDFALLTGRTSGGIYNMIKIPNKFGDVLNAKKISPNTYVPLSELTRYKFAYKNSDTFYHLDIYGNATYYDSEGHRIEE
jgi:hypothetical protein